MLRSRDSVFRRTTVVALVLLLCTVYTTAFVSSPDPKTGNVTPSKVSLTDVLRSVDMVRARHLVDTDGGIHIDSALVQGLVESDVEECTSLDGPFCQPERKKRIHQLQRMVTEATNDFFSGGLNLKGLGAQAKIHVLDGKEKGTLKNVVDQFKEMAKVGRGDKRTQAFIVALDDKGKVKVETLSGGGKPVNTEAAFVFEKMAERRASAKSARESAGKAAGLKDDEASSEEEGRARDIPFDDLFEVISKQMDNIDDRMDETFKSGDEQIEKLEGALKEFRRGKEGGGDEERAEGNGDLAEESVDDFLQGILEQLSASGDMVGATTDREMADDE